VHLVFRFSPEDEPSARLKLKVELNTREHQPLLTIKKYSFIVKNDWYSGSAEIVSFAPAELFGTKLRALLQRNKGRDLFDLEHGLTGVALSSEQVVDCLLHYLKLEGVGITRAEAEQRMLQKLSRNLTEDIAPLLPANVSFSHEEAIEAFNRVWKELVQSMPGNPWKATQKVVSELRQDRIPNLLLDVV
jgi:predicted nucleotidyltransferase component of viral defense system